MVQKWPVNLLSLISGLKVVGSTVCKLGALEKARFRKVHFSGGFPGFFDFLRIACSLGIPLENL